MGSLESQMESLKADFAKQLEDALAEQKLSLSELSSSELTDMLANQKESLEAFAKEQMENLHDLAEKVREAANQSKEDMESDNYFVDPMDPKKYIQQQDTTFDDALQLGIVLTLIYACVQVLRTIEGSA